MRAATALVLLALGGCFAGESVPISGESRNVSGTTVSLRVEPAETKVGNTVSLTLKLVNNTGTAEQLTFPTAQRYDFWVTQDGRVVWRWSEDMAFAQVVTQEELPGQSGLSFTEVWVPDEPGEYTVHARLLAEDYGSELTGRVEVG